MTAIEYYDPIYPNNLPITPENPYGIDPRNWIVVSGGGGTQSFVLTGAVTGSLSNGIVATTLNASQDLPSTFLNLVYEDSSSYGNGYFLSNFLPNNDPQPILNFVSQTGSTASQSLRRWDMRFKQGLASSVTNEFELSMYHSLLPGNTITPFKINYSLADAKAKISMNGIVDVNNNKLINLSAGILYTDGPNLGQVLNLIASATYLSTSITDFSTAAINAAKTISLDQFGPPASELNLGNKIITNVQSGLRPTDVVNNADLSYKISSATYPSSSITDFSSAATSVVKNTVRLNEFVNAPNNSVDMGNQRITSVATPVSAQDASNKAYVDGLLGSTWTSYTPSITCVNSGTPAPVNPTLPSASNYDSKCFFTIVGKTMFINFSLRLETVGTAGTGLYLFSIPSGYTIDSSVYTYDTSILTRAAISNGDSNSSDGTRSISYQSHVGVGVVRHATGFSTDVVITPITGQSNNKLCLYSTYMQTTSLGFLMRNSYINSNYFNIAGGTPITYKFNAIIKIL